MILVFIFNRGLKSSVQRKASIPTDQIFCGHPVSLSKLNITILAKEGLVGTKHLPRVYKGILVFFYSVKEGSALGRIL